MTIAAGLLCSEGVLLCADTEEQAWITKSHASKIRHFTFPGGMVGFAYAGNTRFASSAIRKCQKKLNGTGTAKKPSDPLSDIEETLDKEYRRNVLTHPNQATDRDLHYHLLIALWLEGGNAKLYVTDQTALDQVGDFECIGIGESLARHLIKPGFYSRYCQVLPLAAYALSLVKDQMRDCDGMSIFTLIGNDGTASTVTSAHPGICTLMETYAKGYQFLTTRLLSQIFDPTAAPEHIEANLEAFNRDLRRTINEISLDRSKRELPLANANPKLTPSQVALLALQLSMGLKPDPQPSLE